MCNNYLWSLLLLTRISLWNSKSFSVNKFLNRRKMRNQENIAITGVWENAHPVSHENVIPSRCRAWSSFDRAKRSGAWVNLIRLILRELITNAMLLPCFCLHTMREDILQHRSKNPFFRSKDHLQWNVLEISCLAASTTRQRTDFSLS